MPAPTPDMNWIIHPDIITASIQALVKVVGAAIALMGSSLVGTLLYIWHEHKKAMSKMSDDVKAEIKTISHDFKADISRVASSLENISSTLFDRQRIVENRMSEQETRCEERYKLHRRNTDL